MLLHQIWQLAAWYTSCLILVSLSITCQHGEGRQECNGIVAPSDQALHLSSLLLASQCIPFKTANASTIGKPQLDHSLDKRRKPIRPMPTKTSRAPSPTETITFLYIDWIYTQEELRYWVRKIPEAFAGLIVGLELEPRHDLHLRLGAFSLDLYAVVELLTQSIVLAVLNRLTYLFTRDYMSIGLGEVTIGAGVKVLFAASIRLQGLEDVQREVWQRLLDYVG